jgi:hypothetical protein
MPDPDAKNRSFTALRMTAWVRRFVLLFGSLHGKSPPTGRAFSFRILSISSLSVQAEIVRQLFSLDKWLYFQILA